MKSRQFVTLFENCNILVFANQSDEIFIRNKKSGVELRIGEYRDGFNISSIDSCNVFIPTEKGFRIERR